MSKNDNWQQNILHAHYRNFFFYPELDLQMENNTSPHLEEVAQG